MEWKGLSAWKVKCSWCLKLANSYLGGSAQVAPNPPAVRLSRSTRPAARRQNHCDTIDLTPQGPTLVNLRRIRIR